MIQPWFYNNDEKRTPINESHLKLAAGRLGWIHDEDQPLILLSPTQIHHFAYTNIYRYTLSHNLRSIRLKNRENELALFSFLHSYRLPSSMQCAVPIYANDLRSCRCGFSYTNEQSIDSMHRTQIYVNLSWPAK